MTNQNEVEEHEEVDVEEFAKGGKPVPKAKKYRIRIDRERYTVSDPVVNGQQLLTLAGKEPLRWRLHQKLRGGQMIEVRPGDEIDLRSAGVERFVTMELTQTDGEATTVSPLSARRDYRLPEDDEQYLDSLCQGWEAVQDGRTRWIVIDEHPIPPGYNVTTASLAIRIEGGYPPAALDMAYFFPPLSKTSGTPIPQTSDQQIGGRRFQRWSRHYSWREGVDTLVTHHLRVQQWLIDELKR